MKTSTKKTLGLQLILFSFLFLLCFVFDIFKIKEYAYFLLLTLGLVGSIFGLGWAKNKYSNQKEVLLSVGVFALLYQVVFFVLFGFTQGFVKSAYQLGISHFFKIVLPVLLVLLVSEVLRHQMIAKTKNTKLIFGTTVLFFVLVDFFIAVPLYNLCQPKDLFELFSLVLFPSILKNIFLTFMVDTFGWSANILYRLLMEIPIYYLPIYPNISEYLQSVLAILVPFVFLVYFYKYKERIRPVKKESERKQTEKMVPLKKGVFGILCVGLVGFVSLMSGLFPYYFLAIGSNSMYPNIQVGDLTLIHKVKDKTILEIGDIIAYQYENKVIVHRIVEIKEENSRLIFKTKGDNNDTVDSWDIQEDKVIGTTNFKISYIGYPTVWLNELFNGGN